MTGDKFKEQVNPDDFYATSNAVRAALIDAFAQALNTSSHSREPERTEALKAVGLIGRALLAK